MNTYQEPCREAVQVFKPFGQPTAIRCDYDSSWFPESPKRISFSISRGGMTGESSQTIAQNVSVTGRLIDVPAPMAPGINALSRGQRLNTYIARLRDEGIVSEAVAYHAWQVWQFFLRHFRTAKSDLLVPDATPGHNGELLLFWDRDEHHFEAEISPDLEVSLFYRNRTTGKIWGEDLVVDEALPAEVEEKLRNLL
jgi:hypothetical protein